MYITRDEGAANIYACPGACLICLVPPMHFPLARSLFLHRSLKNYMQNPRSMRGKDACLRINGTNQCGEGHHGIACATCKPNWAQDASQRCIRCEEASGQYLALFVAACTVGLVFVLYFFSARPIRLASNKGGIFTRQWYQISRIRLVRRISDVFYRLLEKIATRFLALTCNSDPYAAKAFAKPGSACLSACQKKSNCMSTVFDNR